MSKRVDRPVTARDYWKVAGAALFWMLILWILTAVYDIPPGSV